VVAVGEVAPELADPVEPADVPGEVDGLELEQLSTGLRASELSEVLYERLAAWLMSGAHDPALERALSELGDNALQVGFDLLTRTGLGDCDPPVE
jgi:hypothetical protein